MNHLIITLQAVALAFTATAASAAPDEGMWLFNNPPTKHIQAKYGFELTPEWLEHVQKSCVRFSTGGSGSIVSSDGLVLTNHHVGSDMIAKLSTAENDLLTKGFLAQSHADELACPDLELDCLWEIRDVTERVEGSAKDLDAAAAFAARRKTISEITAEAQTDGMHAQVVTLYQGGRYHLYRYKRYTDVRLVFAPEKQAAFFGGDPDNFEYPRFNLDMCLFRIYEDGKPLEPSNWLRWSKDGVDDGELVFVAGHPGTTERMFTSEHLRFIRDVRLPFRLAQLWRLEVWFKVFSDRSEEWRRIAEDDLFGIQNSRKALMGQLGGLQDPAFFARKVDQESKLRAAVDANAEWKAKWGDAWEEVARAQTTHREIYERMTVLGGVGLNLGSQLSGIAKELVRSADEREKASAERLPEYSDASLESLQFQLFSPAPIETDLEAMRLETRFSLMCEVLGAEDATVARLLAGKSPRDRARELVAGTKLGDVAERKRLYEGGKTAVDASKDPLIALIRSLDAESRRMRTRYENEVKGVETAAYAKIAAAQFAVHGEAVYPDATFTLRLSFGRVQGYEENGKAVPAFTKLGGKYARADERKHEYPYQIPERWEQAKGQLDLETPYNFVSGCDIIGGNSGSPTVDSKGEVVGLIFDGNIQSLVWNFAFDEVQGRALSVDSRAMLEALHDVYGAHALAAELTGEQQGP